MRESRNKNERAKTDKKRKILLRPIYALVGEMNGRLKALLNKGQLDKYESVHQTAQASADKPKVETPKADKKTTKPDAKKTKAPPSDAASPPAKAKSDAS